MLETPQVLVSERDLVNTSIRERVNRTTGRTTASNRNDEQLERSL